MNIGLPCDQISLPETGQVCKHKRLNFAEYTVKCETTVYVWKVAVQMSAVILRIHYNGRWAILHAVLRISRLV